MANYDWLFMPINVNNNHWVLLAVDVRRRTISVLDSLHRDNNIWIERWMAYMLLRAETTNELAGPWETREWLSARQEDGSSCGPFVLLNALAITRRIDPAKLTHQHALAMRSYVLSILLGESRQPKDCRSDYCDDLECRNPNGTNWIYCRVCNRWLHFECANITEAPGEDGQDDFVCVVCAAQYS
ncbi:Ubiquitin-like-specific protease 1 [Holothuria leucospilota]|uniref:Ubiquitin-like-specific protease 1 n=1 Tax=Holothuria leucospilota TaxID=206669 RepID=A0A9Q1GZV2_HOLLE|nr:Ubiquitin-like-specific protease 1 [Holothuria leucospilota]